MITSYWERPETCSTFTSVAPSTPAMATAIRSASPLSSARSAPNTLTARSLFTPEMSSFTRSAMGWEKENRRPGIRERSSCMAAASSARERPPPKARRGLSITKTSVCSGPMGSSEISARPVLETTASTSGKAPSRFSR